MTFRSDGAGRDGQLAVQIDGIGNPADVPELEEDLAARLVHGAGDEFPTFHLLLGPDAGCVRIADSLRRDGGGFREDHAEGTTLRVVLRHHRVRHASCGCAAPGERCHDHAVGKGERSGLERLEQGI